jgi:hypothetical protein
LGFEFFSPGAPGVLLREGYAGYIAPCWILVVLQITSFLPSVRELEFLLFDGSPGGSSAIMVGGTGSPCTMGSRPPSTSRVAGWHSVEEVGVQLLEKRDVALPQGGTV